MVGAEYPLLRFPDVPWLLANARLSPAGAVRAKAARRADELVAMLLDDGEHGVDAARAIPFMLRKTEAVHLACRWARLDGASGAPGSALAAAETWARAGDDAARFDALERAAAEGFATPGAWAGMSAFFAGESLAPAGSDVVRPDAALTPSACVTALELALERHDAPEHEKFVRLALAAGGADDGRAPQSGDGGNV